MSTKAMIGKWHRDGTYHAIRVTCDGGLDALGTGRTLFDHYKDPEKVDALLALGMVTHVGREIGEDHDPRYGVHPVWCVAARRDWHERPTDWNGTLTGLTQHALCVLAEEYTAYLYVMRGRYWAYALREDLLVPLELALQASAVADELTMDVDEAIMQLLQAHPRTP